MWTFILDEEEMAVAFYFLLCGPVPALRISELTPGVADALHF